MSNTFKAIFVVAAGVRDEHKSFAIRQVYAWLRSKDEKIVLVSKDGTHWQFPGGKPLPIEVPRQALMREVYEETGISLPADTQPTFFGYYHVQEVNDDGVVVDEFLQLRFAVDMNIESNGQPLSPQEHEQEDVVAQAVFATLPEACKKIAWLGMSDEKRAYLGWRLDVAAGGDKIESLQNV
jgi:8-oxo-dGTP pyrophosphatase MutT (NUDIX family)